MFSWIKRLTAASAVLSLGALAILSGCDNDDCNSCGQNEVRPHHTTYINGGVNAATPAAYQQDRADEVATPTSYEGNRDRDWDLNRDLNRELDRKDRNDREVIAPSPGFDREMDRYQHPNENLRQNINTNAPDYRPNYAPHRLDASRPADLPADRTIQNRTDINLPPASKSNAPDTSVKAPAPAPRATAPDASFSAPPPAAPAPATTELDNAPPKSDMNEPSEKDQSHVGFKIDDNANKTLEPDATSSGAGAPANKDSK